MTKLNIEVLTTQKFGKLQIVKELEPRFTNGNNRIRRVEAICDCGVVKGYDLRSIYTGKTRSCGCLRTSEDTHSKYQHKKDGKYLCTRCKEYKEASSFFKYVSGKFGTYYMYKRDGLREECKECAKKRKQIEFKNRSPRDNIGTLVTGAKTRAKRSGIQCTITKNSMLEMYDKQNGKCAITGIPFEINLTEGKNSKAPSIDRIDPNKGYTIDNVQLVCSHVNMMKSNLSMDELYEFCIGVLNEKR